ARHRQGKASRRLHSRQRQGTQPKLTGAAVEWARSAVAIGTAQVGRDFTINIGAGKPSSYSAEIANFIRFYSDESGYAKPFVGRERELEALNLWLAETDAEPNLLVTAPAGRGKSMLLVRWLAGLHEGDLDIIFVPISLRYGTSGARIYLEA